MLKNKNNSLGLYCFSPPIMLATFVIEIILLGLTLWRRKLTATTKLIATTLFFLAFFQLCEYFVCGGLNFAATTWSRLGFVAITTLPPLGIHLVHSIAKKQPGWLVWGSYAVMAVWITIFGFTENAFTGHQCVSNYVIFQLGYFIGYAYTVYYYGLLLLGVWLALRFIETTKAKKTKLTLQAMIVGYLVFLLPTAIANTLKPETMAGIPSIMCGFAVLFALILYGYILPRVSKA